MLRRALRWFLLGAFACAWCLRGAGAEGDPPQPRVRLSTSMGVIVVELDAQKAPLSTANFLAYVRSGHYDGTIFHRVMRRFMIQGGGFTPGMKEKPAGNPIRNESGNGLSNLRGTLAMARTNDPDSATAQFFINVRDNQMLDPPGRNGGYAVFGRVIDGLEVVDDIQTVPTGNVGGHSSVPLLPVMIKRAELLSPGTATPVVASKPSERAGTRPVRVRWRLASSFLKTPRGSFQLTEQLCKRVDELTDGGFQISAYGGGSLFPVRGLVKEVGRENGVEAGHVVANLFVSRNAAFAFDSALPFGLSERRHKAWMRDGGGLGLMREFYRPYGFISFPGGSAGPQKGIWSRKEIRSRKDLKGLRVNIEGLGAQVFAALGAEPQRFPPNEVVRALERGSLDAAEWPSSWEGKDLRGLAKVAKYYYHQGWMESSTYLTFYVNLRAWEALPETYRAAFEKACAEVDVTPAAQGDRLDPAGFKRLATPETSIRTYPADVMDAARAAAQRLYAEEAARNPEFKTIYESWEKSRNSSWGKPRDSR